MISKPVIETSNLYYKYRAFNKAFVRRGQHRDVAPEPGRHQKCCPRTRVTSDMQPPWIPLILGVKVLHILFISVKVFENSFLRIFWHLKV